MENKFIFVCLTPYQVFIAYSYITQLKKESNDITSVLVFVKGDNSFEINTNISKSHFDDVYTVPELFSNSVKRYWKRLFYGGRLFKLSKLSNLIGENTTLLIFNDTEPITWKLMKETKRESPSNKIVLLEEGVGLYNFTSNKKENKIASMKSILTRLTGNEIKFQPVGLSEDIDTIIAREPDQIPQIKKKNKEILKQSIGGLFEQPSAQQFIDAFFKGENSSFYEVKHEMKNVLFIDQPISEYIDNINSYEQEVKFMAEIFDNISKDTNIIIKPHPRDDIRKYDLLTKQFSNITVITRELALAPIECVLAAFRNSTIITYNSSAGINAKYIVPEIRVCFTYSIFYDFIGETKDREVIKNIEMVHQLKGENCIVASNLTEVSDYITYGLMERNNREVSKKLTEFDGEDIIYFRNLRNHQKTQVGYSS
ncbi:MAG: hypothetical protein FH758_06190 [Firmicutes bacterium]|nr:hypothetical protein [Bacillota bacterium]